MHGYLWFSDPFHNLLNTLHIHVLCIKITHFLLALSVILVIKIRLVQSGDWNRNLKQIVKLRKWFGMHIYRLCRKSILWNISQVFFIEILVYRHLYFGKNVWGHIMLRKYPHSVCKHTTDFKELWNIILGMQFAQLFLLSFAASFYLLEVHFIFRL